MINKMEAGSIRQARRSPLRGSPGEPTNEPHYTEAESLCAMLGFDLTALRAAAAATIPYAKLWRDEVTDDWAAQVPIPLFVRCLILLGFVVGHVGLEPTTNKLRGRPAA
jgi:hypothetical protein